MDNLIHIEATPAEGGCGKAVALTAGGIILGAACIVCPPLLLIVIGLAACVKLKGGGL